MGLEAFLSFEAPLKFPMAGFRPLGWSPKTPPQEEPWQISVRRQALCTSSTSHPSAKPWSSPDSEILPASPGVPSSPPVSEPSGNCLRRPWALPAAQAALPSALRSMRHRLARQRRPSSCALVPRPPAAARRLIHSSLGLALPLPHLAQVPESCFNA